MADIFIGTFAKNIPPGLNLGIPLNKAVFNVYTNDIIRENTADIRVVSGTEKLKQDIVKILFTDLGENIFLPEYGSQLQFLIGQKMNFDILRGFIEDEIIGSLRTLQFLNRDNENLDEQIDTLDELIVEQDPDEVRRILVSFTVTTMAETEVTLSFPLTQEAT